MSLEQGNRGHCRSPILGFSYETNPISGFGAWNYLLEMIQLLVIQFASIQLLGEHSDLNHKFEQTTYLEKEQAKNLQPLCFGTLDMGNSRCGWGSNPRFFLMVNGTSSNLHNSRAPIQPTNQAETEHLQINKSKGSAVSFFWLTCPKPTF